MQQAILVFPKFRFVFAGILTTAFLVALSALVTTIGSGTVLATKAGIPENGLNSSMSDTPNSMTTLGYSVVNGAEHIMYSIGVILYQTCRSITTATVQSGKSVVHGSAVATRAVWTGTAFVGRAFYSSVAFMFRTASSCVMFTIRLPGNIIGSITSGHAVGAIIRPADYRPTPTINTKLSAAMLARINVQAQQDMQNQQEIAQLQAAQLAANRGLDGSVVAGDPNHGGYPTAWDTPTRQDSTLDSWGMYNRECVSYAAWKVYQTYGSMPYWGGVGNANQWVGDAKAAGIPTTSVPKAHSVAISMSGYYGHAMWVEKVSGDMIYVSQYNYDLHGHYSEMWVSGSSFTYIYFK